MATRNFNTAYMRMKIRKELETKRLNQKHHSSEAAGTTIEEFLKFMELKAKMGIFQSFDPRDFGADYDIVSIPLDNTPEYEYWFGESNNN